MSLEDQNLDRKSRLAALRSKRKLETVLDEEPETKIPATYVSLPFHLKEFNIDLLFSAELLVNRNFDIESREVIKGSDLPPSMLDENSETVEAVSSKISGQVLKKYEERATQFMNNDQVSIKDIKGTTSDLQKDIKEQLDLLQDKTDQAIKNLTKERIRRLQQEH